MAVKHIVRIDDKGNESSYQEKTLTPLKAIRLRCLDCCSFLVDEVNECVDIHCANYLFRFGKDPSAIPKNPKGNPTGLKNYRSQKAKNL